jgi:hypothetical protein
LYIKNMYFSIIDLVGVFQNYKLCEETHLILINIYC